MPVNEEARGQHHQREVPSATARDRGAGDEETEKWQDDEARHPWNEQSQISGNELQEFPDRAEMPGGEEKRQAKKPAARRSGPGCDQSHSGAKEKRTQRVERNQLSVEGSGNDVGEIVEESLAQTKDVPERGAGMVKSEPAIVTESFPKLFCLENLKRIRGVIICFVKRRTKERLRAVQDERDKSNGDQNRRAPPPPTSRNGCGFEGCAGRQAIRHGRPLSGARHLAKRAFAAMVEIRGMTRIRSLARTTTACAVALTIAAWFSLSNHCALGTVVPVPEAASNPCPMHSAPAKKKPASKAPCCKDVRAVVAKCVTANPAALRLIGTRAYITEIFPDPAQLAIECDTLDTGPPGCLSFAESVLQESMLSHAPPVS